MNMNRTTTMLVLLTALLVTATVAAADLPAQEPNLWAPEGDLVGTMNHGTVTMGVLDGYGFEPKYAEDKQLNDKFFGSLLFGWQTIGEQGNIITMRSLGGTQLDGRTAGHITFSCLQPGKRGFTFDYRGYDFRYDTTSEMRAASFAAGPPPAALAVEPSLNWNRAKLNLKYQLSQAFHLDGGFTQTNRVGDKASLLRGAVGAAAPGVKAFDMRTDGFWVRGNYSAGDLATSLRFGMDSTQGNRGLGSAHTYVDDQLLWNLRLDASYDVNGKVQVLGGGLVSRLANDLNEVDGGTAYLVQNEATTSAGQLGVAARLGSGTTVRLGGQFKQQDTDAQKYASGSTLDEAMTRDRSATLFQAKVTNTGLAKTHLQAWYKYTSSDLDEVVAQGALPETATAYRSVAQETKKQQAGLKVRRRFSNKISMKARLDWSKTEITESTVVEVLDWTYDVGDRDIDRLNWQVGFGLKPMADLKLDLGFQAADRTFKRVDLGGLETSWKTQRGFLTANWMVMPRLTILAAGSLGTDKYEADGAPVSTGTMGPLVYDGTTLRFAPGAVYTLGAKTTLEAIYEGVRFEDKGDAPAEGNQLNSDYDNLLLRANYDVSAKARVAVAYRRQEFDENRFDDYILDIYSLSVSGRF